MTRTGLFLSQKMPDCLQHNMGASGPGVLEPEFQMHLFDQSIKPTIMCLLLHLLEQFSTSPPLDRAPLT